MAKSAIGPIVTIDNTEIIKMIIEELTHGERTPRVLEFAINGDGLRLCIDRGIWSPPVGKITSEEW